MKNVRNIFIVLFGVILMSGVLVSCDQDTDELFSMEVASVDDHTTLASIYNETPISEADVLKPEPVTGPEGEYFKQAQLFCITPPLPVLHTIEYLGAENWYPPFDIPVVRIGSRTKVPYATSYTWFIDYQDGKRRNCFEKYTGSTSPSVLLYTSFVERHGPVRITRVALRGHNGNPLGLSNTFELTLEK